MKHNVAFLPADRKSEGLFLEETVLYNILLANLEGVEEPWIRKKLEIASADKYIGLLRIKTPSYYTFVRNLSGGNQQKVLIARWLFKNAEIIIFDEPTRGIDVNAKVEVYRMMGEIVKNGGAVIMVSSDLPELEGICDRVLVFHNNKIIKELKGADLTQEKISYHSIVSNGS
jgi:ribose transport system ATP-binding protein